MNTKITIEYSDGEIEEISVPDEVESGILEGAEFNLTVRHPNWESMLPEPEPVEEPSPIILPPRFH